MRRSVAMVVLAITMVAGALGPAFGQAVGGGGGGGPPPVVTRGGGGGITPLGWYVGGAVICAAAAPIIGTIVLNREMTQNEVYRSTLTCFLGPLGWVLADAILPPDTGRPGHPRGPRHPPSRTRHARGHNISVPPAGETDFVSNEVLVEIRGGASPQQIGQMTSALQLTLLETQNFSLTGRELRLYRIDSGQSARATLPAMRRFAIVIAAQVNHLYRGVQAPVTAAPPAGTAQYVVSKLHLNEAHRITNGDNVLVAVIDSQIDLKHPDLTGAFVDEDNVLGTPATPHAHGTAMAGAIAAHSKLIGVAPKVRILAVRAFSGQQDSAQGTTFNILKGLDWAAGKNARIVNMSFAGSGDPMLSDMFAKAYRRGIVLIAAVGNAGPRSPPLFPASDSHVIGVTATDANDKLLPQATRGPQVTVAAPGVAVLADAPDGGYQLTSGTSVAAAHATGVAALLLAREPKLTPAGVRRALIRSARKIPGKRRDVGAGVIDALAALNEFARTQ
jgi:subtilisin family serine protease